MADVRWCGIPFSARGIRDDKSVAVSMRLSSACVSDWDVRSVSLVFAVGKVGCSLAILPQVRLLIFYILYLYLYFWGGVRILVISSVSYLNSGLYRFYLYL